jgi:hypothetical protein
MQFGLSLALAMVAGLLVGLLPTCLYLYVEPRGRRVWAREGDSPSTRRAPALVRGTAWFGFVLGQLAIPWLLVPVACGALLYAQAKLGFYKPMAFALTASVAVMALAQAALAIRLIPLSVRLLMRDAPACTRAAGRSRSRALANASVLGAAVGLSWSMAAIPGVHPWLTIVLGWAVLRPVMGYAVACLLHAALFKSCIGAIKPELAGGLQER